MDKQAQRLPNGMQMVDLLAESKASREALDAANEALRLAVPKGRAAISEAILTHCVPAIEAVTRLAVAMAQGMRSAAHGHEPGTPQRDAYAGSIATLMVGTQALHEAIRRNVAKCEHVTGGEEMN